MLFSKREIEMKKVVLFFIFYFLTTPIQIIGMDNDYLTKYDIYELVDQIRCNSIDFFHSLTDQHTSINDLILENMKEILESTKYPYKYLTSPIMNPLGNSYHLDGFFHQLYYLGNNYSAYTLKNGNFVIFDSETKVFSQIFYGHKDIINSAILLKNGNIATASKDMTIKIWDIDSGSCCQTLEGHRHQVRSLIQLKSGILVSASWDKSIKIWDHETGQCLATLEKHNDFITKLLMLRNGNFISVSKDNNLIVWRQDTFECLHNIQEKGYFIHSIIELQDGKIAFVSGDNLIKIWDLATDTIIQKIIGHKKNIVHIIELKNGRLASASSDGIVKIWNYEKCLCEKTINTYQSSWITSLIELDCGLIGISSKDSFIKIISPRTGITTHSLSGHFGHIYQIKQLENGNLISSSDNAPIVIWELYPEKIQSLFNGSIEQASENIALLSVLQTQEYDSYSLTTKNIFEEAMQRVYHAYGYAPPSVQMIELNLND